MKRKITVSVLGCGWYGLPLAEVLASMPGFSVKGSTTSADKLQLLQQKNIQPYLINFDGESSVYDADFFDCDILWITIPPKVRAGGAGSYIKRIQDIINAALTHGVTNIVHISSTGVYGDNKTCVDEHTPPCPTTEAGMILLQAEDYLKTQTAFTTTIIRFGGLFGPGRDAGRFFAGKANIFNGQAPVNMIHLDDCLGISLSILNKQAFGYIFNACSPQHPQKAVFYTKAAQNAGLPIPRFLNELNEWKQVDSVNIPELLDYNFKHNLI